MGNDDSNHRGGKDYNEPPHSTGPEVRAIVDRLARGGEHDVDDIQRAVWDNLGVWLPTGFIERIIKDLGLVVPPYVDEEPK